MKPVIFAYDNYREFLKDMYLELKRSKPTFSFRFFARQAGFSSPNFLKLVMEGKRNLSVESIQKFSRGLKLANQEAAFFESLVCFNQAQRSEEKSLYFERMTKHRRYRDIKHLEKEQFEYLSHWYYSAVRELTLLKDFRQDPNWIAQKLACPISPKQVKQAIALLLRLKLLARDEYGHLRQVDRIVSSGDEVKSVAAKAFHKEMLEQARQALDRFPASQRDISAVMLAIPSEKIPELKARIAQFRKDLLASLEKTGEEADQLMELNIALFPLTKPREGK